ncbi:MULTISPECIES: DUF1345 domain-containing protein [Acinetobacter]|uniref:DUF1345 domain-containing protein n=1 Tax=Acinetobacter TaxID=469 RepID=UPI000CDCF23E|nr:MULTISPECIES: DUF1345 domain-containing protein [Acinetobacter]MCU4322408.1 DUF1345 domain-containing protein [Acinetobacter schindleri]POU25179.1 DUF1345 domain-containing protein [Acinetobacter sp. ACNIH3]POV78894.1 DUF1345 domain-containing protein [Acinetobacter sp. ACNIH4]
MRFLQSIRTALQSRLYFFIIFPSLLIWYFIFYSATPLSWSTCILMSWNITIYAYLLFTIKKLWHIDHHHILQRAIQQDASKWVILVLVIITLVMCFIAIIIEINHLPKDAAIRTGHLGLSILTIISAWFLMHTIFAIHYAHDFYLALEKHKHGGLAFPSTPNPTYPDFLYFSYIIGTSAQTADVSITRQPMRVLNTLHLLLAYGFNTTILAIAINVTATFIST